MGSNIKPCSILCRPRPRKRSAPPALQFVRKIRGFTWPSHANQAAFEHAIDAVAADAAALLGALVPSAGPCACEALRALPVLQFPAMPAASVVR